MKNDDAVFSGSIPELYDTYMVPLMFEGYALDLARRIAALDPRSLLEVASGTGVVPRALVGHLHPEARYVVSDLNQPMLDFAAGRQAPDPRLSWRQADALDLSFDDDSFDVVLCQFGAMFYPDRSQGYAEARRVLKASGHFIFSVWDRIERNEFAQVVTEALATVFPQDPPRFMARTPHGYHDPAVIRADLARAGFADAVIEPVERISSAPSARHVAMALCQGTPLRAEIAARDATALAHATEVATAALQARYGQGEVSAPMRAFVVTAAR